MINESLILSELFGLVGFRNPTITGYSIVNSANQVSGSGLYFQDGHKLVTIKNIYDTQEDESINDENFNIYLQNEQKAAIIDVCNKIIRDKSIFVESGTLFPYEQTFENTIDPGTGFIGIKIKPTINERLLLKITAIIATFNDAITLPVYLYNSETGTQLYSQNITTIAKTAVKQRVNWAMSLNTNTTTGGSYYLGYKVSDIGAALPYKRDYENSTAYIPSRNFYSEFRNNELNSGRINPDSYNALTDPYGLNIQYSVYTDWTQKLIENKNILARAIQLQMAERVIEQIFVSTRSNIDQRKTQEIRNMSNYILEGNEKAKGIRMKLNDEINNIRKSLWPEPPIQISTLR